MYYIRNVLGASVATELPGAAPVKVLTKGDVIAAKRHSAEERQGSKGSSRSKSASQSPPRGRDASPGRTNGQEKEQSQERLKERKERKRLAFEMMAGLEERAKQAADRHLQERANRVEALRADLKEKREAKLQKALDSDKKQERAQVDGENSPRKRTTMLRTTARSLVRVSLKLPLLESGKSIVQVPGPKNPPSARSSRKLGT
eukprot:gnl/MRDRNA2_/MRDRNA2_44791_c0_seq2.p1 gnl/MRDRNA2_/MRDRNA2_44791_c0~~gnl/MRDRNA2_/MRDRNA2_44791_c0_seq2.p1  ORF type:complete len:232 (-),score=41.81 gnl/MRDRNA2_/MRDRNA2_44791_c0_seq2:33-641(-)